MSWWVAVWFVIVILGAVGGGLLAHELVHFFGGGGDRLICFGYDSQEQSIAYVKSEVPFSWWGGEWGAYSVHGLVTLLIAVLGGEVGRRMKNEA